VDSGKPKRLCIRWAPDPQWEAAFLWGMMSGFSSDVTEPTTVNLNLSDLDFVLQIRKIRICHTITGSSV